MTQRTLTLCVLSTLLTLHILSSARGWQDDFRSNWPQWRGPTWTGVAENSNPPTNWSESENLAWKVPIAGRGHGTPVIWRDRIFLQTAIELDKELPVPDVLPEGTPNVKLNPGESVASWKAQQFAVICLDRDTGAELWTRVLHEAMPHQGHHLKGCFASQSAITDGKRVYCYFGSYGLYCLDMQGEIVWQRDPRPLAMEAGLGEGGSPALYGDTLILVEDHELQSTITAIDTRTGKQLWQQNREEVSNWSTPRIFEHNGQAQVLVNGETVRNYDLLSGELLWECSGQSLSAVPMPAVGHGLAFATTGWRKDTLHAIRLGQRGNLTDSEHVVWSLDRGTPYVPSPMLWGDEIYLLEDRSFFSCLDAKSGEQHYLKKRVAGSLNFSASPVGADDRIYLLSEEGRTVVVQRGPEFEVLAINDLDDSFMASPAIVGDSIFLRGQEHVYCIQRTQ
jgi:outer membrane protein assembly factor BamB